MAEKAEGDVNAKLAKLALTDHLVELTKAISASPATFRIVVDGCLQQGLITDHVHGDLTDPTTGRSLYEKAGELISNIETAVGVRASYLRDFLKILAKDGGILGQKMAEAIASKFGQDYYQEINPQQKDDFTSNPKQPPSDIDIEIYQPYFNMKFTDDLLVLLALEDLKPEDAVCVFSMEDDPFVNRILQLECSSTKIETMYYMWKEKIANDDVTYSTIIEALLCNNHHIIAQSIGESLKEKYQKPENISHFHPEQSYPNWDGFNDKEKDCIKRILRSEMTEITKYFNKTFITILLSFEEAHRNHCGELMITLNRELKTSISFHLKRIKKVRDVFKFIEKKGCNWINYHLLDVLTYHHGSEEDKLQMKDYVKKLWTYLQRSLYKIPLQSCEAMTAEIHEYHFILPITRKKDISGQQMKQIQLMLAEKLNIPVAVIKIKARTGSIIIHFIVNKQYFSDHDDHTCKLNEFLKDTGSDNIYYIDVKWLENIPYNSELLPKQLTNETTTPPQIFTSVGYKSDEAQNVKSKSETTKTVATLEKEKAMLKRINSVVINEKDNLATTLEEVLKKKQQLQKEIKLVKKKLVKKEKKFQKALEELQGFKYKQLQRGNQGLAENQALRRKNQQLQNENQQLQNENQQLQSENQQLQNENQQLQSENLLFHRELHQSQLPEKGESWKINYKDVNMTKQELGMGAWGMIQICQFRGQKVAVKQIHETIMSEYNLQLLHREINTMSQLRHPNIVQFIGAVLDDPSGQTLIITEIMDMSLRDAYEKKQLTPVPVDIPLAIMRDVAVGLNYLHCLPNPIIHRDVSSANVLLESKGPGKWKTKISDFGSAVFAHSAVTEVAVGTLAYSAPESLQSILHSEKDQPLTPKMDVFSYGVLLCEVLTCQFPDQQAFKAMLEQVHSHLYIYDLIQSCIKRNPQDRPDMDQVIQQLDTI